MRVMQLTARPRPCLAPLSCRRCPHRLVARVRAASGDSEAEALPAGLTAQQAYEVLGLPNEGHTFEQILTAKNKQLAAHPNDQERQLQIEAAYDVLFMQSMKKRISGELEVSSSVRYADVPTRRRSSSRSSNTQASLLQKLPGGGISVEAPKQNIAAGQAAVFAGLGTWAILQAVLESPDMQAADTAGLQLAAALGFAVYGFKEWKKLPLGRAVGLSVGALVAGILLGAGLNAWLQVDIVPIGSFASPGVLVSTFGIVALGLASAFLA